MPSISRQSSPAQAARRARPASLRPRSARHCRSREIRQQLVVAQARIVAADGEVAGDPGGAKMAAPRAELRQEELEDQREPDHQRLARRQPRRDLLAAVADVDHLHRAAVPLEHGRQVPHAEIALVLVADQDDLGIAARAHRLIRCSGVALTRREHIHRRLLQELGGLGRSLRDDPTDLGLGLEPVRQELLAEGRDRTGSTCSMSIGSKIGPAAAGSGRASWRALPNSGPNSEWLGHF